MSRRRSPRGMAGAIVLLFALPLAFLYQLVFPVGAEVVIHVALGMGAALVAFAILDFRVVRWVSWVGATAAGALAVIFLLQGASEIVRDVALTRFAYQLLGQNLEGILVDLVFVWCLAAVLTDSTGRARVLGLVAMVAVICVEVYSYRLELRGTSLDAVAPMLKLVSLLPFLWLLLEGAKAPPPRSPA